MAAQWSATAKGQQHRKAIESEESMKAFKTPLFIQRHFWPVLIPIGAALPVWAIWKGFKENR